MMQNLKKKRYIKTVNNRVSCLSLNARSIKNKDLIIKDLFLETNVEFAAIAETWIPSNDFGDIWTKGCDLNTFGLKIHSIPRPEGRGGGIALITKSYIDVNFIETQVYDSFESGIWKLSFDKASIHVAIIYRPPTRKLLVSSLSTLLNSAAIWLV